MYYCHILCHCLSDTFSKLHDFANNVFLFSAIVSRERDVTMTMSRVKEELAMKTAAGSEVIEQKEQELEFLQTEVLSFSKICY